MRKQTIYILIGLLVALIIFTTFRLPFAQDFRRQVQHGFTPFLLFTSRIQQSIDFLLGRVKGYTELQAENIALKEEKTRLAMQVAQVTELERENRDFRTMLDFKNRSELKLISARVISRDPSNWFHSVLIDRGTEDGIKEDMPVLTVDGLVGKTTDVTASSSHVLLLVDDNFKVSAWMKESAQYGIVQGSILISGKDFPCRMTFIDRFAKIKPDDQILTSGLGTVFPKGIPIGTVRSVKPSVDALYQEVNLKPAVELSQIDEVFIGIGVSSTPPVKPQPLPSKAPTVKKEVAP